MKAQLKNWWNSKDEDTKIELSNIFERLVGIVVMVVIYLVIKI